MTSDLFSSSFARFDFWSGAARIGPRGPILPTFTCHCPVTLHCACLESWHQLKWLFLKDSFLFFAKLFVGASCVLSFCSFSAQSKYWILPERPAGPWQGMWQCLWWPSVFDLMLSWKDTYVLQSFSPSPIGIDTFFIKTISVSQGWIVQSALNLSVTFINDTGIQCNAVKYIKQCIIMLLLCSCEFASRKKKKERLRLIQHQLVVTWGWRERAPNPLVWTGNGLTFSVPVLRNDLCWAGKSHRLQCQPCDLKAKISGAVWKQLEECCKL